MKKLGPNPAMTLAIAALAGFFSSFANSSVIVALPTIGREFGADTILLNWIVTAFALATAAILIPSGRAADIFGRKRLFVIGLISNAVVSVAAALAPSIAWLLGFRVFQGFSAALLAMTSTAILISVFPPERRGHALGINVAAIYVGLSAGPVLGGLMIHDLGWRSLFWVTAVCCGLLVPLTIVFLRGEWRDAKGEKLDLRGALLYAISLVVLMVGLSRLPHWEGIAFAVAGLLGLSLFLFLESKSDSPMLDVRLFRSNRTFAMSNLAAMISYSSTFAVSFFLSLFLQTVKGFTARDAGMILLVQPLIQAILSPLSGRFSDRWEPRVLSSAGMALSVAGLALLVFLNVESGMVLVISALALLGIGFALFSSPNTNAIMSSVEKRQLGVASATVSTMRTIGQVASMALALLLSSLFMGTETLGPNNVPAYMLTMHTAFALFALLSFAGIFASLARGKVKRG